MATKKVAGEVTKAALPEGSALGKSLQEKQIANLEKAKQALEDTLEGYVARINSLNDDLVNQYYKIQEKEAELAELEVKETKSRVDRVKELEVEIKELEKQFDIKQKDQQVTFDLAVKANKQKVMRELMQAEGLANISSSELTNLTNQLVQAEESLKKGFAEEVGKAKAMLTKQFDADITTMKLTHEKEQSSNEAKIEQMQAQIKFLEGQLVKAEERVINILDNQVKIAQADKGIIINTTDKK